MKKFLPFAGGLYLNSDINLNVQFFQSGFTIGSWGEAMEEFKEEMNQLHRVNEEMQRQLKTNINKRFLLVGKFNIGNFFSVCKVGGAWRQGW